MAPTRMKVVIIDGQTYTTDDVINKLGCARSTATKRIKSCDTLAELFAPVKLNKKRIFTIEGSVFNVNDVVAELQCSNNTAYNRLNKSKTIEQLFKPIGEKISDTGRNPHNKQMSNMDDPMNKLLYSKW